MKKNENYIPSKIQCVISIILFCGFLTVMLALFIVLPKKSFSENEKRELAEMPAISAEGILKGDFSKDFETYLSDGFAGRDFFVGLNAYYNLYSLRQPVKDIFKSGDILAEKPVDEKNEKLDKNIKALNRFADSHKGEINFMLVPSSGWFYKDSLASIYPEFKDDEIIGEIGKKTSSNIKLMNMADSFDSLRNKEKLYYYTDHHWTSLGAYYAYAAYCEKMGFEYEPQTAFEKEVISGFHGSTYSRSALWLTKPENIEIWRSKAMGNPKVTIDNKKTFNDFYFYDNLSKPDKYTVFLDGNHASVKVNNSENKNDRKLLVVADSFGHCIVPFLSAQYSEVQAIDMRYYKNSVSELIEKEKIDDVLVLYSLYNFSTDSNLIWLK